MLLLSFANFFQDYCLKKSFKNTIKLSNSLDPDQYQQGKLYISTENPPKGNEKDHKVDQFLSHYSQLLLLLRSKSTINGH